MFESILPTIVNATAEFLKHNNKLIIAAVKALK